MEGQNEQVSGGGPQAESVREGAQSAHSTDQGLLLAICAYIGPLVVLSYIFGKDNGFVRFHTKQGLVLLLIELIVWVLGRMLWPMMWILGLVNLAVFVLSIIGIVNVVQHKEKELPLVGTLAKHFKI